MICIELGENQQAFSLADELYINNPTSEDVQITYVKALIANNKKAEALSLINSLLQKASSKMKSELYYQKSRIETSDDKKLSLKFDALASHDITYVGIIQTAKASGLETFPIPYVLTNCHNSLCAVGGTINEDDHMFGLTCAKKYGGIYVPPHQAVIHQFAREMLAGGGKMILGSDSHTRYGALGTMAMGEGGPELVKQLLNKTDLFNIQFLLHHRHIRLRYRPRSLRPYLPLLPDRKYRHIRPERWQHQDGLFSFLPAVLR
mgnify:CR=1 FL=1